MKINIFKITIFSILFSMSCFCAYADIRVYGNVHHLEKKPVKFAEVSFISLNGDTLTVTADSTGFYEIFLDVNTNVGQEQPLAFTLNQNYPNPFNPSTTIEFWLERSGEVNLDIFNVVGQKIKSLLNGRFEKGYHSVVWNGIDNSGKFVSAGIYIYTLQAMSFTSSRKMILLDSSSSKFSKGFIRSEAMKPVNMSYKILVNKDGFLQVKEDGVIFTQNIHEVRKDFSMTAYDFYPFDNDNVWSFRNYDISICNPINSLATINIGEIKIINNKRYYLLTNNWNKNIPDSVFVRREGEKIYWRLWNKDWLVYDFNAAVGSTWEFPSYPDSLSIKVETIEEPKSLDFFTHPPNRIFKFTISGTDMFWFDILKLNWGPLIIKYYNLENQKLLLGLLEYYRALGGSYSLDYEYYYMCENLNRLFEELK